ncbi:MAG: nucleoside phosphorylase [Bacteroidales bacterium]|jgi:uridine phosphorylase|nr:nucleoside phosphorylase [Bacteroidales bacterium]MBO7378574.1 nucleoside phosphorylase [Bacteroidales bacterium]MBP5214336.1 nucleoside phosphorylase [Bacteroidales bacterium]MBP5764603.1 nucleoside phosphorylase [Bacteroidales bacterium]
MIPESEFVINSDGSCFHLHLRPEQLARKLVICGDPGRVDLIASHFDSKECEVSSREFHTITGTYKGKRITTLSHGIGPDNIDIVLNELDALVNVDFQTREIRKEHTTLEIVRVGTCGGLQPNVPCGTSIVSGISIGFDGVLDWYAGRDSVSDLDFERELTTYIGYPRKAAAPYVVRADEELASRIAGNDMVMGVTCSAVGFYGPQGRVVRLPIAAPLLNERLERFEYQGHKITNYEMESAPLAGFARLMGHKAVTVCSVVANRVALNSNPNYKTAIEDLVVTVLDRI